MSPETRAKISAALAGRKLGPSKLRGRKQPPEVARARAEGQRKHDTCTIEGCGGSHTARGYCSKHYERWRTHGDPTVKLRQAGDTHPCWKGEDVGYDAVHWRARTLLPRQCAACGTTSGRLEIALLRTATDVQEAPGHGPYSTNPDDYVRLCVTCHRRYDSPRLDTRTPIEEALTRRPE